MTSKIFFLLLTFTVTFSAIGQNLLPTPSSINHNKATRPCLVVNLDPEPETLKKAWKVYLKDNHDFKINGIGFLANKDLLSEEEVVIEKISPKALNFYSNIVENDTGSEMKVFAAFGYDIYINPEEYPAEQQALQSIMEGFIKEFIPSYYAKIIKDTESKIKDLIREDKKLEKGIKKAKDDITDLEKEIKDKQSELKDNEDKLRQTKVKLKAREENLERVKSKLGKM